MRVIVTKTSRHSRGYLRVCNVRCITDATSTAADNRCSPMSQTPPNAIVLDRRCEPRLHAEVPIRMWGNFADGTRFDQTVCARNISLSGALLSGIGRPLRFGDLVYVEFEGQRARFRVVWSRYSGTDDLHRAAIHRQPGEPCPWAQLLQAKAKAAAAP